MTGSIKRASKLVSRRPEPTDTSSSKSTSANIEHRAEIESEKLESTEHVVQKFLQETVKASSSTALEEAELASARMSARGLIDALDRARGQTSPSVEASLERIERLVHRARACQKEIAKLDDPRAIGPDHDALARSFEATIPVLRKGAKLAGREDGTLAPVFDKKLSQLCKLGAAMGVLSADLLVPEGLLEQPSSYADAQALLEERGASVETQIHETSRGKTRALRILPDPKTRLGQIAKRLEAHGVELVFSPIELQQTGARGIYSSSRTHRRLYLDFASVKADSLSTTGKHELRHAKFHWARTRGEDSMFHMSFHAFTNTTLSRSSAIYQQYMSAEELSTFPQSLRHDVELLEKARGESKTPHVPGEFQARLESVMQLAAQSTEVTRRAVQKIDEVLDETSSKSFLRSLSTSKLVARHRPNSYAGHHSVSFMISGAFLEIPIVTKEQKAMYERVETARSKLDAYLKSKSGLGMLLASRREIRSLRDELHAAERALLTNLRDHIQSLSRHADAITKEAKPLLSAVRKYEALRYGGAADSKPEDAAARYQALIEQAMTTTTRMVRLGRSPG